MIYLLPHPVLLDWEPALRDDAEGEGAGLVQRRMRRLTAVLRLIGRATHSAWLGTERFKLILTYALHDQFWKSVSEVRGTPASRRLGDDLTTLIGLMGKVTSHLLMADQEKYEHEADLDADLEPPLGDASGDLAFALACITRALQDCNDPSGALASILVVTDGDEEVEARISGLEIGPTTYRLGRDPASLGTLLSEVNGHQFPATLSIPCETRQDWRVNVDRKSHESALLARIKESGGSHRPGKGDHRVYELRIVDYLDWRKVGTELCVDSLCTKVSREREFQVSITVDRGRNDFRPRFSRVPAAKTGMPPALAWQLLYSGRVIAASPRLADLLSGLS